MIIVINYHNCDELILRYPADFIILIRFRFVGSTRDKRRQHKERASIRKQPYPLTHLVSLLFYLARRVGLEAVDPDAISNNMLIIVIAVPGPERVGGVDDVQLAVAETRLTE